MNDPKRAGAAVDTYTLYSTQEKGRDKRPKKSCCCGYLYLELDPPNTTYDLYLAIRTEVQVLEYSYVIIPGLLYLYVLSSLIQEHGSTV